MGISTNPYYRQKTIMGVDGCAMKLERLRERKKKETWRTLEDVLCKFPNKDAATEMSCNPHSLNA